MKRILTAALATAGVAAAVFAATALGQAAPPSWPPGDAAQVFIWSDTVTLDAAGQQSSTSSTAATPSSSTPTRST